MKKIERIQIDGAVKLTPPEMNKIHFESGRHTERNAAGSGADAVRSTSGAKKES